MSAQHTQGLVEVTKEQFFGLMGARNVHPRPERDRSVWIVLHTDQVIGITTPGYMAVGAKSFSVVAAIAKVKGGAA